MTFLLALLLNGGIGVARAGTSGGTVFAFGPCSGGGDTETQTQCCILDMSSEVYEVPWYDSYFDFANTQPRDRTILTRLPIGARVRRFSWDESTSSHWPVTVDAAPAILSGGFRIGPDEAALVSYLHPITVTAWQRTNVCVDWTWNRDVWERWLNEPNIEQVYGRSVPKP